jgi:hypothetical protein
MRLLEDEVEQAALTWFGELVEHWQDIPEDFKIKLGLRPGLVLV